MPKLKAKELTTEERLQKERENGLSRIDTKIQHLNKPTYFFDVGDKVQYGSWEESIIDEIMYDGKVYGLRCTKKPKNGDNSSSETYIVAIWTDIRPLKTGNTNFGENPEIRLDFYNTTVESLIHRYYSFGVNMDPDYQREYVWEQCDKEYLIDSVFKNIEIGRFAFVHLSPQEWDRTGNSYEILDGKQRLNALIEYYENRYPYNGVYYNISRRKPRPFFKRPGMNAF